VAVADELRSILLKLWKKQGSPISGYILARAGGERCNLDNESKRVIAPVLANHKPRPLAWHGWYSLRRFHGTAVVLESGDLGTSAGALGNSKAVAEKHYLKVAEVLPKVRKAVIGATAGLTA
jgi:hypothetical protein